MFLSEDLMFVFKCLNNSNSYIISIQKSMHVTKIKVNKGRIKRKRTEFGRKIIFFFGNYNVAVSKF